MEQLLMYVWSLRFDALTIILTGALTVATVVSQQSAACAKTAQEIAQLAILTTVEVNNTLGYAGGSGVIIAKQGNIYTVLTANHVVASLAQEYSIRTYLEKDYTTIAIQRLPKNDRDIDLALIQFQSREQYPIAPMGNSESTAVGSTIYVSGYPLPVSGSERKLEFTAGIISSRLNRASSGYGLRYQAVTRRGMSGGPVFDVDGRLAGIHGQGDTVGTVMSQWNGQNEEIKTGLNSAIPIDAFIRLLSQTKPNSSDILSSLPINRASNQSRSNFNNIGGFLCDTSTGGPVTVYQNAQGLREPWIRWSSNFFSRSGYDPLTRCQQVTQRLEIYRRNKQLNYVTVGIVNNQKAICTTSRINGACEGLIYTLRRDQDPIPALNTFFVWLANQKAKPSLYESGTIPYINVQERLEQF
jgi:serine protease Do